MSNFHSNLEELTFAVRQQKLVVGSHIDRMDVENAATQEKLMRTGISPVLISFFCLSLKIS